MNKIKSTKRALIISAAAVLMSVSMLIGTTYAWFTDTASAGVNKITSGNLYVAIQNEEGTEIDTLEWVKEDGTAIADQESILWEPGCTYLLTPFKIANTGKLALKYKIVITGLDGDSPLLDVIKFTYKIGGIESQLDEEGHLGVGESTDMITVSAHMDEAAGNDYMNKTLTGISFTVYATQDTVENDSYSSDYDENAAYPVIISDLKKTYAANASIVPDGFVVTSYNNNEFDSNSGKTGTITIKDAESLLYLAYVLDPAAALANEPEDVWPHTSVWYGGAYDRHIVLDADIDLQGITLPNGFGNMKDFTFDGQGHTIKNATINYIGTDNVALFVGGNRGISNLVVENIKVIAPNGTENAAGIVSSDANALIDNVTVRNSSVTGGKYTGAVVGYNYGSVTNCTVENCTVIGRYKVGGVVGYICNSNDVETFVTGNTLDGVTVKGENLISGKTDFVIGKIVGNWNATVGTCNNNTFSGTTTATENIGEVESRCTVTQ